MLHGPLSEPQAAAPALTGAPVSVVIPVLNAADTLGPCLGALAEGLMSGLIRELILADGGSDDAIAQVADAVGARLVQAPRGRGTQLAAGARAAEGAWLLFLHADSVLAADWPAAVRHHLVRQPDSAGYFRLRFDSRHPMARVTERWANLRARAFGLPYGDQGLLIPRTLYHATGGFPEIPLMEDVALARALAGRLRPLEATIVTSADRYQRDGWLRRGGGNLVRLVRYLAGTAPDRLARHYDR